VMPRQPGEVPDNVPVKLPASTGPAGPWLGDNFVGCSLWRWYFGIQRIRSGDSHIPFGSSAQSFSPRLSPPAGSPSPDKHAKDVEMRRLELQLPSITRLSLLHSAFRPVYNWDFSVPVRSNGSERG